MTIFCDRFKYEKLRKLQNYMPHSEMRYLTLCMWQIKEFFTKEEEKLIVGNSRVRRSHRRPNVLVVRRSNYLRQISGNAGNRWKSLFSSALRSTHWILWGVQISYGVKRVRWRFVSQWATTFNKRWINWPLLCTIQIDV